MAAATIAGGALFGACNRGPSEREKQLEQRVQELEQQAASPEPTELPRAAEPPAAAPGYTYAPPPAAPTRPAARASSGRTPARPAPVSEAPAAPAPRGTTTASAPASAPAAPPAAAPMERIPDEEVAREDSDWPATQAEPGRETTARETEDREEALVVPTNTELSLRLETPVSSKTSQVGDRVTARVERATGEDGTIVLPGGTVLHGRVTEAEASGRVKGRARVAVSFDRMVVRGRSHPIQATVISAIAPDSQTRDAKIIGGSAVAGAIIGALKGGKSGAAKGAVVGAGAGTGAVLVTKGQEIEMPAGSRWTVRTRTAIRL
jgi:hypothetical protein